jgi:nucleotide-binding universal stress UspA family protein
MEKGKTVVVAVDRCKGSDEAFAIMLKVVKAQTDKVVLVHARPKKVPPPDPVTGTNAQKEFYIYHQKPVQDMEDDFTEEIFVKYKKLAKEAGVDVSLEELQGDARHCIVNYCAEAKADLLIIGNRGRHGVVKLLLGSVSEYVVHHATCSVLVARASPTDTKTEE